MSTDEIRAGLGGAGVAFLVAAAGTWVVLQIMQRWQILDRPNERSSHKVPMPTLGGVGIIAGFWAGIGVSLTGVDQSVLSGTIMGPLLGAVVILLLLASDDMGRPLKVGEKVAVQVLAMVVWLYWGPHLEQVTLPLVGRVELGLWGWGLTGVWFVVLCNVFNFMDGIDGIVATEAISVGCLALWCHSCLDSSLWSMALVVVAATGGFLVFNFPPARIFMGDVGAVFLGFVVAALGVLGEGAGMPLWVFAVLLGCFLFDTIYTLVRRALRGENVLKAHRKHLYQRLNTLGWSHLKIDLGVFLLTLILGAGGWTYLFAGRGLGAGVMALGGLLLVGATVWIERRDRSFV